MKESIISILGITVAAIGLIGFIVSIIIWGL
jgi:preprotein translocase subunit Sss1